MNVARREQWKQAFTFEGTEIGTLGDLLAETCLGVFAFLWPGHQVLVFAVFSITYSLVVQLVFVRAGERRILKALAGNIFAIVIFAAFIRFSAR